MSVFQAVALEPISESGFAVQKGKPTNSRQINWEEAERLDWHLWILSFLLICVLGLSLLSFMFPSAFWMWSLQDAVMDSSQRAFFGFCTLLGLTLVYLLQRQATVRRLKRQLFAAQVAMVNSEREAAAEAFRNLPGTDQFRDTLAMEFRRAGSLGSSLAGILLTATNASPEALGAIAKRVRLALRQGESMYRISNHALGIILPKMGSVDARAFTGQLELSMGSSGVSFECRTTAFPEEVSSLSEMESRLRGTPNRN